MSFGGHVLDMINRSKYNRDLIKSRRQKTKIIREKLIGSPIYKNNEFEEKHISPEELKKIKNNIRLEIKRERQRALFFSLLILLIVLILIVIIGSRFSKDILLWEKY